MLAHALEGADEEGAGAARGVQQAQGSGAGLKVFERCSVSDSPLSLPSGERAGERVRERGRLLAAWQKKHRALCWVDPDTGDIHLTVDLKRRILTQNIYGVDLDAAAVEVTQLSLYLKMLEHENRTTLQRQRELLSDEKEIALLPPLQDNIKCGNSLIASDFSMMSEDLVRVRAFDWPVQFAPIMKAGGFDAVIGNPPYGASLDDQCKNTSRKNSRATATNTTATFTLLNKLSASSKPVVTRPTLLPNFG